MPSHHRAHAQVFSSLSSKFSQPPLLFGSRCVQMEHSFRKIQWCYAVGSWH